MLYAVVAQSVERIHGKNEVSGSDSRQWLLFFDKSPFWTNKMVGKCIELNYGK